MSVITSALSTYCDQNRKELLSKSVAGANTFATTFTEVIPGIKPKTQVQFKFFSNEPYYQWDTSCAPVSGSTTFTEKLLSTTLVTVTDEWCADDLTAKLAQYLPK